MEDCILCNKIEIFDEKKNQDENRRVFCPFETSNDIDIIV
jgi:hypothetical protein